MKNVIKTILSPLVFLFLLLEELFWAIGRFFGPILSRLKIWHRIEILVEKLPATAVVFLFLIPGLALFPIKILALSFIAHGHFFSGVAIVVLTKIVGTALSAKLFMICKYKLMTVKIFAVCYNYITTTLAKAHIWINSFEWVQNVKASFLNIKAEVYKRAMAIIINFKK